MGQVWSALGAALGLDAAALGAVGLWAALGVALLATASNMLGHVAILLLNRLTGLRLLTTLALNLLGIAALHTVQAAVTWGVAQLFGSRALPLLDLVTVALLSVAPLVFAFLTAIPHFGIGIGRLLGAWEYLIWWFGVAHVLGFGGWASLAVTAAGWLVMQVLSRLAHAPLNWAVSRLWTLATGRPTMITSRDVLSGMLVMPVVDRRREARQ